MLNFNDTSHEEREKATGAKSRLLPDSAKATATTEVVRDSAQIKVAQLELHVTTVRKDSEGVRSGTAVTVLAEYFRTITKERTIRRVAAAVSALLANDNDAAVTLYSRRGKPLIRLSTNSNPNTKVKETALLSPETKPEALAEIIAKHDVKQVIVKSRRQLEEIAPIAERLGLEKIFVPRRMRNHVASNIIEPIGSAIGISIELGIKHKEVANPEQVTAKDAIAQNTAVNSWHNWPAANMPALSSLITITATPGAEPPRSQENRIASAEELELARARSLMERLAQSIDEDLRTGLAAHALRPSLTNLGRSVGAIRAQQPELYIPLGNKAQTPRGQNNHEIRSAHLGIRQTAPNELEALAPNAAGLILAA